MSTLYVAIVVFYYGIRSKIGMPNHFCPIKFSEHLILLLKSIFIRLIAGGHVTAHY